MDRKKFFKDKIMEMRDTHKPCRRKLTFITDESPASSISIQSLAVNISPNHEITDVSKEREITQTESEMDVNNPSPHTEEMMHIRNVCEDVNIQPAIEEQNLPAATEIDLDPLLSSSTEEPRSLPEQIAESSNTANLVSNDAAAATDSSRDRTKKPPLRTKQNVKIFCEFVSDNEDPFFTDDTCSWDENADTESNSSLDTGSKKKKKKKTRKTTEQNIENSAGIDIGDENIVGEKGKKKKKINKKKANKENKQKGIEYLKTNGSVRTKREIKPNPCQGKKCGHDCQNINEDRRMSIFRHFWGLDAQRQRDWLVNMSRRVSIKRKRNKDSGKRTYSYEYYINDNEDRRQVCQQFLLNTLDVTQTYVYYTLANSYNGSSKDDLRGKTIPANKTKEDARQSVTNFIKKLPALPSHYCRKDSSKLYLPTEFKNNKNLYRIYKEEKTSEGIDVVSEKVFLNIFKDEFNIGFHVPKKDKCVRCMKLDALDTEESRAEKEEHFKEKDASKERYNYHRELSQQRNDVICTSFDLQKVLNTPYGESMLLYYSRKYAVYNLCFYENGTREGYCYIWGETEGKRGANEVASILTKYIHEVDARKTIKHLILYSDSCPGQNKNKTVLAVLHNALSNCENLISIQMNYLLPGHTEMTVDSMHSVIEGSVKNTIVWAPSQWATICQLARKEPRPYKVIYLDHTDFQGFDQFADRYFRGNLTGKISKIRVATLKKSKMMHMAVKTSMKRDTKEEVIAITGAPEAQINKTLYTGPLAITKKKYGDLKKLCEAFTIPKLFHKEFLSLSCEDGVDTLMETDIEDIM